VSYDDTIFAERLRTLFEHVDDAIFIKDATGRYLLINRAGATMLGKSPEQIVGHTDADIFVPDAARDIMDIDRAILETGESRTYVGRRMIDGSERYLFATKLRSVDPNTGEACIIGICRDITEREQIERQLATAERLASLGALAGGITHEVKNPLTYALGGLSAAAEDIAACRESLQRLDRELGAALGEGRAREILARSGIEAGALDRVAERLSEARHGAERVHGIVDGLRRFGPMGSAGEADIDLRELLDSVIHMAEAELRYRARVVRAYGRTPPVCGQEPLMRQLFLHVLVSVARGIPEGAYRDHEIRIATTALGEEVQVEISEPIVQARRSLQQDLDLSVTRYLVAAHRGAFELRDRDGGAVLAIRLPCARPEARQPRRTRTPSQSGRPQKRARILVVDDEPLIRSMLRRMLGRAHQVSEASSGMEALDILQGGASFDAIFCDLMMPELTGMDVFEWLEENRPELVACTAFVTGGAFTERGEEFLGRCTRPVLGKPFDRHGLSALLDELLCPGQARGDQKKSLPGPP
jgi:PAS domain S-box-containing protein